MNETSTYTVKLQDAFSSPLKTVERNTDHFENKLLSLGDTIKGVFAGSVLAGAVSSFIGSIKEFGVESFNAAREFTNLSDAIKFASGADAGKNIAFLDELVNRLGLDLKSTYTGFKTFEGALMGTTLEGEEGRKVFEAVSKAASVMKLSADNTEGAFLALGQMISKGTVSAEELRGQLGERLPGAFQIAARAMGVTTAKLGDMMKKGEVAADVFLPKFAAELEKTFGPGIQNAQSSFNAKWNRLQNTLYRFKLGAGQVIISVFEKIFDVVGKINFQPLANAFSQLWDEIKVIGSAFGELWDSLGLGEGAMSIFQNAVTGLAVSFHALTLPIRGAISLVRIVVDAIRAAIPIFTEFNTMMSNIFTLNFDEAKKNAAQLATLAKGFATTVSQSVSAEVEKEKNSWLKLFGAKTEDKAAFGAGSSGGAPGIGGLSPQASGKTSEAGVEKIHAGTRNVTLNIQNLVKEIKFETFNNQSTAKMVDVIKRTLLDSVNDVNIVAQ